MEIKLDRKKDYITKSDHKEQIMKYLSWKIKPFALYHEIREISRIFNFSPEEIESILKELEDENKIFPLTAEGPRDIHYMLKADIQLQLLIDMKKSPQKPAFLISSRLSPSNNWRKEEWVIIIQDYVLGKNLKSQLPSYADFEPLRYILMHMPTFPEWMPFFQNIPIYIIDTLFHEYKYIWASGLLHPNITCMINGYFENEKIEPTIREKYKLEFAFYQYILPDTSTKFPKNFY